MKRKRTTGSYSGYTAYIGSAAKAAHDAAAIRPLAIVQRLLTTAGSQSAAIEPLVLAGRLAWGECTAACVEDVSDIGCRIYFLYNSYKSSLFIFPSP